LQKYGAKRIGGVYCAAIKLAKKRIPIEIVEKCKVYIFSDSIAIFSIDKSLEGFLSVVSYVKSLMQYLIPLQLPIRGAIAFGKTFVNEEIFRRWVFESFRIGKKTKYG